jgi:hypothetical protein
VLTVFEHMFVHHGGQPAYHQREEIERLRRSIAMLQPGSQAMSREDAMQLLSQLGAVGGAPRAPPKRLAGHARGRPLVIGRRSRVAAP